MDLTKEHINSLGATAKAYDAETDMGKRVTLGAHLDELAEPLSAGQLKQVVKIINRM